MKITGGVLKGRSLIVPPGVRATTGLVRQAIYNIIGPSIEGSRVLDGFAGSGAVGFEAISRGASFVAFVEPDSKALIGIRDNLERFHKDVSRDAWRVMQLTWGQAIPHLAHNEASFDLVFLDPPYHSTDAKNALNALNEYVILAKSGIAVLEHDRHLDTPSSVGSLKRLKQHRYGETVLSLYQPALKS